MEKRFIDDFFRKAVLYARLSETKEEKEARVEKLRYWRAWWKELAKVHFYGFKAQCFTVLKTVFVLLMALHILFWVFVFGGLIGTLTLYTWPFAFEWYQYTLYEACKLYTNVTVCPFGLETHLKNVSICLQYRAMLQQSKTFVVLCHEILNTSQLYLYFM